MLGFALVLFLLSFVVAASYMLIEHFGWKVSEGIMTALFWCGPGLAVLGMILMFLFG